MASGRRLDVNRAGDTFPALGALVIAVLLVAAAALLRFFDLENNPPGFWQDEVSTGLDAYLLWTTARDRAGVYLPIISRSFGDYPLALYRYLDAPIVGLLGRTVAHQRWVAAFAGTVMVGSAGWVMAQRMGRFAGIATLLTTALCPMAIHFSRYGSEAILLPACLTLGWACFEAGRQRSWLLWAAAFVLGLSTHTYHAVKVILPIWIVGFLIFQLPEIQRLWRGGRRRHVIGPAFVFVLTVLPAVIAAFSEAGQARGRTVLAWYHVEASVAPRLILANYLSYFDPGMLFVRGGPAVAQSIPGLGLFNLVELPLVFVALIAMLRPGPHRRLFAFLAFWFLLGPLPGGLTYETHNVGRAIAWLPSVQMISATGSVILLAAGFGGRLGLAAGGATADGPGPPPGSWPRRAIATVLALAWALTAYVVSKTTLVEYPELAQRDWQFEISGAMRCALAKRNGERLIVSPSFQVSSVFAQYFFEGLPAVNGRSAYAMEDRAAVKEGELYLFPSTRPLPKGTERCRVTNRRTGQAAAFVFGPAADGSGAPAPEAEAGGAKSKVLERVSRPEVHFPPPLRLQDGGLSPEHPTAGQKQSLPPARQ